MSEEFRDGFLNFIIILALTFNIAATSIGIQCFSDKKDTESSNYKFLITNVVLLSILLFFIIMFYILKFFL